MAVETVQNEKEKIKVSPQGWLALVIMLCMFSGFFANKVRCSSCGFWTSIP